MNAFKLEEIKSDFGYQYQLTLKMKAILLQFRIPKPSMVVERSNNFHGAGIFQV